MSNLYLLFKKIMKEYGEAYNTVIKSQVFSHPLGDIIRHDIKNEIESIPTLDKTIYKVKASCGAGRWTITPWISIFDTRITNNAKDGVYIVYLLNKDTKTLYLTLIQGVTSVSTAGSSDFKSLSGLKNTKIQSLLSDNAKTIRKELSINSELFKEEIDSGIPTYNSGCICYKKYTLDDLPNNEQLISDINLFIKIYQKYYSIYKKNKKDGFDFDETVQKGNETLEFTIKKSIEIIKPFISSKGFSYPDNLIQNFYLSLKSKPFVILAGTSGTGKTRLVKLFAEAIGAEYKLVPVRPDWSDSSDLFGHTDLNGNFKPGAILDFISAAQTNKDKPYILCLDEMNLARVEYYLSDILSVIETRDWSNGEIITSPLLNAIDKYPDIIFPENLYLVGTVNMDETTFPFSKKVLDRANTIEFNCVDLIPDFTSISDDTEPMEMPNSFLRTEYLNIKDCVSESDYVTEICTEIQDLNTILQKANAHVGYRVRDEIAFYMLYNHKNDLLDESAAFDNEIMQKILPRIQGSSSSVSEILCDLFKFCSGKTHSFRSSEDMEKELNDPESLKYKNSANKLYMMMKRYEDDGFTSFWL